MSTVVMLGKVCNIESICLNGEAIRLTLQCNLPFKTKYYTFVFWDTLKLKKEDNSSFALGETVEAECIYNTPFYKLIKLHSSIFETCPVCYQYLPVVDTQRINCNACTSGSITNNNKKIRIDKHLKLVKKWTKKGKYDIRVLHLHFYDKEILGGYRTVIYKRSPLYEKMCSLKKGETYEIVGWATCKFGGLIDIVSVRF